MAVALLLGEPVREARALTWGAPTTVSPRGGAGNVQIAFDARGRALALWSYGGAVRRRVGDPWRRVSAIAPAGGTLVASGPRATVAGLVGVLKGDDYEYYAGATRTAFGKRSGAVKPLDGRRPDAGPIDVDVNARGDVAFTWVRDPTNRGSGGTVMVSVWRAEAEAPDRAVVVATPKEDRDPGFAAVGIGNARELLVAWVTSSTCEKDSVVVREGRAAGGWQPPRRIGPIVHGCYEEVELDAALGAGRSAVVGWTSAAESTVSDQLVPGPVYAVVRRSDGSFTPARNVGDSAFVDYPSMPPDHYASELGELRAAVTARREALIAWTGGPAGGGSPSIAVAAFDPAGRLGPIQSLFPFRPEVVPSLSSLSVGNLGTATVLWRAQTRTYPDPTVELASATRPPGGRFGAPATLLSSQGKGVVTDGDLAVAPGQELPTAVFADDRGIMVAELTGAPE